ncbi:MAG: hypothetical protein IT435_08200 [Phycisphaerales bacterium]|nr:hypothetical protein [Phycisphaerales bacterium]
MTRWGIILAALLTVSLGRASGQSPELLTPILGERQVFIVRDLIVLRDTVGLGPDQLGAARDLLSGYLSQCGDVARRTERLTSRAYSDLSYEMISSDEYNQFRFRMREQRIAGRIAAEQSLLDDLRAILTEEQQGRWDMFMKARRALAVQRARLMPWAMIGDVLGEFGLTPAEKSSLEAVVAREMDELDRPIREYLGIHGELDARQHSLKRDFDKERQIEKDRGEACLKLDERVQQAIRMIAGELGGDRGEALRAFHEGLRTQRVMKWTPLRRERPMRDYREVSTLSADQKKRIDDLIAVGEVERQVIYKQYTQFQRLAYAGQQLPQPESGQIREAADKAWDERFDRLKSDVRGVLTDQQRQAYDDGTEPQLVWGDMWYNPGGDWEEEEEPDDLQTLDGQ